MKFSINSAENSKFFDILEGIDLKPHFPVSESVLNDLIMPLSKEFWQTKCMLELGISYVCTGLKEKYVYTLLYCYSFFKRVFKEISLRNFSEKVPGKEDFIFN